MSLITLRFSGRAQHHQLWRIALAQRVKAHLEAARTLQL